MIKKIKVEQMKPGIFVHDFNCGWLHHPFLKNRLKIATEKEIEQVIHHQIREVYIDTDKGLDVDDAPTKPEVDREIQTEITKIDPPPAQERGRVALGEEVVRAKKLLAEVKQSTKILMDDVKLGKQLDMDQAATLVDKMTDSVLNNSAALISLARIKNKDEYTYQHCIAVSALCIAFGEYLRLDDKKVKALGIGGLLHDIGKVRIPLEILNKPGPLSEKEFEIMKEHVMHGDCILRQTGNIEEDSICVTAHHHERLDGTGYPKGLKGDEISPFGQMAAIVDIYDALTSERCYKNPMAPTVALRKLYEWSDNYLNRELVERFIAHLGIYPVGSVVRLQSGFIGVVIDHGEKGLLYPVVRALYDTRKERVVFPFDIDLAKQRTDERADEVVGCEAPGKWHLRAERCLAL
ncbi:MAG TPA: HD-GYP domain-containing protein [Methylomirabilota bacterium]|nr:HD-GYP domain-containing protein [Methylomirabilota bacterium]